MFEPTRLSGEYLIDAYSQTVPIHPRAVRATRANGTEQRQPHEATQPLSATRGQGR